MRYLYRIRLPHPVILLQKKDPKAEIRILDMNVAFAPEKLKPPTSLQLTFICQVSHILIPGEDTLKIISLGLDSTHLRVPRRCGSNCRVVHGYPIS